MGRPPLNLARKLIRISAEMLARIEALVGRNRVNAYIREAVAEKLERDEAGK